jgi:energy-coupling factor transport system ATP-binding protein
VALTLDSVAYEYAAGTPLARKALCGVDLRVERGELVCVLGPSGSGKTTLLRLAAGLLEPTAGSVRADGGKTGIVPARAGEPARVVGIAFQRPESQLFASSVAEDVAFGPRNIGESAHEAATSASTALEAAGLDPGEFGPRSPFTLSGGEARRAALAGVLAMRPSYLLLDEPTAGLDAGGRQAVVRAVRTAREHAGVVVVTHDAEEFLEDADGVLLLRDGRAAYSGHVAGILAEAERLDAQGLWWPPEVVRSQILASRAGHDTGPVVLDPELAAEKLAGGDRR